MTRAFGPPPSLEDVEAMAREAFETIPNILRVQCGDVPIRIQDFADAETLAAMGIEGPFELLGLYHGASLAAREAQGVAEDVDMVFLYRRPILDYWSETEERLEDLVRHVLIHEIGHHFGFSDEDMEAIENGIGGGGGDDGGTGEDEAEPA
jgi:predicted Zn-dependent protease with MMP-like domain